MTQTERWYERSRVEVAIVRAVEWLFKVRNEDLGWANLPGRYTIGQEPQETSDVIQGMVSAGISPDTPRLRESIDFLLSYVEKIIKEDKPEYAKHRVRARSLMWATWALLDIGEPGESPSIQSALTHLNRFHVKGEGWAEEVGGTSCVHETSIIVQAMHKADRNLEAVKQAKQWLISAQNPDGGWGHMKGEESVSSCTTLAALSLIALGENKDSEMIEKAAKLLLSIQNPDGSWLSYKRGTWIELTTPWTIKLLLKAGYPVDSKTLTKAIDYLLRNQDESGGWRALAVDIWHPLSCWATGQILASIGSYHEALVH